MAHEAQPRSNLHAQDFAGFIRTYRGHGSSRGANYQHFRRRARNCGSKRRPDRRGFDVNCSIRSRNCGHSLGDPDYSFHDANHAKRDRDHAFSVDDNSQPKHDNHSKSVHDHDSEPVHDHHDSEPDRNNDSGQQHNNHHWTLQHHGQRQYNHGFEHHERKYDLVSQQHEFESGQQQCGDHFIHGNRQHDSERDRDSRDLRHYFRNRGKSMSAHRHGDSQHPAAKQHAIQQSAIQQSAGVNFAEYHDDSPEYDNNSAEYNISGQLYPAAIVETVATEQKSGCLRSRFF